MPIDGLEAPCPVCTRSSGDHTLREWAVCLGEVTTDLPYEPVPEDAAQLASEELRRRFNLDDDVVLADHVVARAAVLSGGAGSLGIVGIEIPVIIHEFGIGIGHADPPVTVAKVAFIADVTGMRGYGRLIRDTANGAANASERS